MAAAVIAEQVRVVGTFFNIAEAHVYEIDENGIIAQNGNPNSVVQDPAPATK
ncbi:hypothetical protein HNP40_001116 [Mycobacteroides chelonae]|nr:hypothetical protein [Mycobacteroides chelonae]